MAEPILRTVGLQRRFGGVVAVDGVDFSVAEGELRCIIGPNGAGKTTFFRLLCGLVRPTAGRVLFRGEDITGDERYRIACRGVAIKTQVPSVFDGLTLYENIRLSAARARKTGAEETVAAVLGRLGLMAHAQRLVGQLSHGQRQWVEIGMLLAAEPALVLLDEPTAGMTKDEVVRTAALIREMSERHTVIVVEHDMQFIKMIAGTVTVFHQGRILVEDTVTAVLRNAQVRDVYLGKRAGADA
jgi:ABC-type uncharacterized transport system ATPase subunit